MRGRAAVHRTTLTKTSWVCRSVCVAGFPVPEGRAPTSYLHKKKAHATLAVANKRVCVRLALSTAVACHWGDTL